MLKPLLDRVLLKKVEQETTTSSGLIISDKKAEKPSTGDVIAVGPGKVDEKGNLVEMNVAVGQRVIYRQYAGTEVKDGNDNYVIVEMKDILAIVE